MGLGFVSIVNHMVRNRRIDRYNRNVDRHNQMMDILLKKKEETSGVNTDGTEKIE